LSGVRLSAGNKNAQGESSMRLDCFYCETLVFSSILVEVKISCNGSCQDGNVNYFRQESQLRGCCRVCRMHKSPQVR
jgi:hypothetical protein